MEEQSLGDLAADFMLNLSARGGPRDHEVTEDFSWWMSCRPDEMDLQGVRDHVTGMNLPPFRFELIGVVSGKDNAAVELKGHCQLPDGRWYNNHYCFIFMFEGRRIRRVHEYCDTKLAFDLIGEPGAPFDPDRAAA